MRPKENVRGGAGLMRGGPYAWRALCVADLNGTGRPALPPLHKSVKQNFKICERNQNDFPKFLLFFLCE